MLPQYCELTLSDEEKAELTEKCVQLLLQGKRVSKCMLLLT